MPIKCLSSPLAPRVDHLRGGEWIPGSEFCGAAGHVPGVPAFDDEHRHPVVHRRGRFGRLLRRVEPLQEPDHSDLGILGTHDHQVGAVAGPAGGKSLPAQYELGVHPHRHAEHVFVPAFASGHVADQQRRSLDDVRCGVVRRSFVGQWLGYGCLVHQQHLALRDAFAELADLGVLGRIPEGEGGGSVRPLGDHHRAAGMSALDDLGARRAQDVFAAESGGQRGRPRRIAREESLAVADLRADHQIGRHPCYYSVVRCSTSTPSLTSSSMAGWAYPAASAARRVCSPACGRSRRTSNRRPPMSSGSFGSRGRRALPFALDKADFGESGQRQVGVFEEIGWSCDVRERQAGLFQSCRCFASRDAAKQARQHRQETVAVVDATGIGREFAVGRQLPKFEAVTESPPLGVADDGHEQFVATGTVEQVVDAPGGATHGHRCRLLARRGVLGHVLSD